MLVDFLFPKIQKTLKIGQIYGFFNNKICHFRCWRITIVYSKTLFVYFYQFYGMNILTLTSLTLLLYILIRENRKSNLIKKESFLLLINSAIAPLTICTRKFFFKNSKNWIRDGEFEKNESCRINRGCIGAMDTLYCKKTLCFYLKHFLKTASTPFCNHRYIFSLFW